MRNPRIAWILMGLVALASGCHTTGAHHKDRPMKAGGSCCSPGDASAQKPAVHQHSYDAQGKDLCCS